MRYSQTPTDHIVVRVETTSDSDSINFGIIHLTEAYRNTLMNRIQIASYFSDDPSFNHISFDDDNIKFYNFQDLTEDLSEIEGLLEEAESIYVTIDEDFDFNKNFLIPEQTLEAYSLRMGSHGAFNYVCYDGDNGDEYWTGGIIL